jgi:uncharacterized protein (TIGR02147 family)
MANIFDFKSYKDFFIVLCDSERGLLTRLADAGHCQKSYLSACLKGKNHLTLDHAFGMAEYLKLSDTEQDYLFLLIEKEKASSYKLKRKLEGKLRDLSREAYKLKNQQNDSIIISNADSSIGTYYSNWLLTAIHTLTSINKYHNAETIGKRLNLPTPTAQLFLNQLLSLDLIKKDHGHYKWNSGNIHLADNSPWITNHHLNWRLRSIDNTQKLDPSATHYTAIQSMSEDDFEILKRKIANFIKDFNKISDPSPSEEGYCFNIDFIKV